MARLPVTRSVALIVLSVWLPACASAQPAPPAAAPVRAAPTRPPSAPSQLWPVTRLRGADYVSVRDVAARFGLTAAWVRPELELTLSDKSGVRFTFEPQQRDFYFDGLRVFLGEPPLLEKGALWLSKLDVIKLVAPLFRPADHAALLPAAAPRTIVLDPGHGGSDPGKENATVRVNEKTFTLDVARRLKKLLEAQGWNVVLTRSTDTRLASEQTLDLQRRAEVAARAKADLFLSIHFNSVERDAARVTGVETYTMAPQFMLSSASTQQDEMTKVAYPGNRQDYANLLLGTELHRAVRAALQTPDRGFKRGRLAVLRFIECPGALVECGYLSNDAEARRIATPEFRQKIAEGLAAGLRSYATALAALRPPSGAVPAPPAR